MHSAKLVCVFSIAIFFLAPAASAEEQNIRSGLRGGIDVGAGDVKQSFGEEDEDNVYFYLGFKGGYFINPHFLIGLELGGWLIEASDQYCYYDYYYGYCSDASEGDGIMQIFLITQFYPVKESGLFVKAGGGYVEKWSNRSDEQKNKQGWGLTVGGGYDFMLYEHFALSPFATFSYGDTGNWDYTAITFGLGGTFR